MDKDADNTGVVPHDEDDWINELDSALAESDAADDAAAAAAGNNEQDAGTSSQPDEEESFDEIVSERETSNDEDLDLDDPAPKDADSSDSTGKGADDESQATQDVEQSVVVQQGAPWSRFKEVNNAAKQARRELLETKKQLEERDELLESYRLQGKSAGIEFRDLNAVEFTEEQYLDMVDAGQEEMANLMLKQQKQLDKLKQLIPAEPASDDAYDDDAPSDEEVAQAIAANKQLSAWRTNAGKGDDKAWKDAIAIDESLSDDEFESLADRYAEVERRVLQKARDEANKKAEEAAATPGAGPARSLNDMGGSTGAEDAFTRLMNMPIDKQMDYMEQLERTNPRLHAELDARIDNAL